MARSEDRAVAELLERLIRAPSAREAFSIALAAILTHARSERGAIVLRGDGGWRMLHGVAPDPLEAPARLVEDADGTLDGALQAAGPSILPQERAAVAGLAPCAVLPFGDDAGQRTGAVLVQGAPDGRRLAFVGALLRRCGPVLVGLLERDRHREREERLWRRNLLLRRLQDALTDPVVLTDADNDILLANQRAEELFGSRAGESVGRTHAIRTNTLLFSAFLTQKWMSGEGPTGRELNLVDPNDGSDLLFEVLTTRLAGKSDSEPLLISVLRDITDLKRAVNELEMEYRRSRGAEHRARQESQRLNAIIENAAEPILVTDEQSRIILMNPEAERLFDVPDESKDRVRRRRLWANVTRFTSLISEFLLQPDIRRQELVRLMDPDTGEELPVQAVNRKIMTPREEPAAVVTVLRDLTEEIENERLAHELRTLNDELEERIAAATRELAERNRLLEWQSRELEKSSRMKSEFLARMSHELRTPLSAVLGYTSLLQEQIYGALTPEQVRALERVDVASGHLLTVINEILDLTKIEAGKMPLRLETVRLEELVATISSTVRPLLDRKGLELRTELAPDFPALHTDPTKLQQVLLNLLQNAVKFTERGWVALRAAPSGSEAIRIEVEDTGIGIRNEDLELIFEDFSQVGEFSTREHGGTGLGLSICRKLVGLMKGTIEVRSEFGEGTCFTLHLPLRVDPGSPEEEALRALIPRRDGVRRAEVDEVERPLRRSPLSGDR